MRALLMGCGNSRDKRIQTPLGKGWDELVTLDMSADCKPDVVHNLEQLPYPFKDNTFDEIHAYEVMEHMGKQGDWRFFFAQFDELARILKPNGLFVFTSPKATSPWLWGDPGHVRYIGPEAVTFLIRDQYEQQIGKTAMTDYRSYFKSNWKAAHFDYTSLADSNIIVIQNLKEIDR